MQVATRVTPAQADMLDALARQNFRTLADELRAAIAEHLKRNVRKKASRR